MKTEELRKILKELELAGGGVLKPEELVRYASKRRKSPIGQCFEWDDEIAGHKYRLGQARQLIRSIPVEIRTTTTVAKTVHYVSNPSEQGYISTKQAAKDPVIADQIVESELRRARSILYRARGICEAVELMNRFDEFIEEIDCMLADLENAA